MNNTRLVTTESVYTASCSRTLVLERTTNSESDSPQKSQSEEISSIGNKVSQVVVEGGDASFTFNQRPCNDVPLTFLWEGNKDVVLPPGSCKSEGLVVTSQAQSFVEVLQELFRPPGSPLQIIIESPSIEVTSERNSHSVPTKLPAKEPKLGVLNAINKAQDIEESDEQNLEAFCISKKRTNVECSKIADGSNFQLIHKCCYCRFRSETIAVVLDHVKKKHPGKPAKTKAISGRDCPYCGLRLDQTAFFHHMRLVHEDSHPFQCGYCNFMGRDLNQLKHHCTKKHRGESFKAFRRRDAEPKKAFPSGRREKDESCERDSVEDSTVTEKTVCEKMEICAGGKNDNVEMIESLGNNLEKCPICHKKFKTLKYLKVHLRVHSKGRFKCGYCSYLSAYYLKVVIHCKKHHRHLQPRVKQHELDPMEDKNIVKNYDLFMEEVKKKSSKQPPDPDARKWARKYSCPTCEYTCNYGASYRRHLTTHSSNPLPYRCHYCSFAGREKYYVRRHIQRVHRGFPAVVVSNIEDLPEQVPGGSKKSGPLRNHKSKKLKAKLPKNSPCVEKCVQSPEEYTEVISSVSEPSASVAVKEYSRDETSNPMKNTDHSLSSGVIHKSVDEAGPPQDILVTNECSDLNVSRDGKERDKGSVSVKLCEDVDGIMVVLNSAKTVKKPLKLSSNSNCSYERKEVSRILPAPAAEANISPDLKMNELGKCNNIGTSEVVMVSNEMIAHKEEGSVSLLSHFLSAVNCSSNVDPAVPSVVGKEKDNLVPQNSKDMNNAQDMAIKAFRKKGIKERSSHKAWDFVAYRDGKYTSCVCGTRTVNKAFYKHIKKHIDFKRFGCGCCPYRSIERAKVKVHHTFVHPGLPLNVIEFEENVEEGMDRNNLIQTLSFFSKMAEKNPESQKDSSSSKKSTPIFQCPICKKKISYHTYTIRRHLFSHCDYRPYKCGRCDFRGFSPGEVKQHSVFHGADLCPIVEPSGQPPPEGLEQLVTDCFNELQMKLGKKIRRRSKSNVKMINPIQEHGEKKETSANGYHLVTNEATIWNQSLSVGICPWCQVELPSSHSLSSKGLKKDLGNGDIRGHFKDHFYKPVGNLPSHENQVGEVESPFSTYHCGSLKEKDAIIMNGLMYYFINEPVMKEAISQKISQGDQADAFKGEVGIIKNPDGMSPGTIQVTDMLLADLRNLLWGHEDESKPRMAHWHCCQMCKQQFRSSSALQQHSQSHTCDEVVVAMEEEKHCDYQKKETNDAVSQESDGEVGVFLLGDDVEVATAVVVINSEAKESETGHDVSL
ncbi:uncharacterized protein LOC124155951 [Ischnura elegans]|uniref:uncharacterized protein LOC124155951 n=1 Tax=Ischnura elegans TaxID=197161 RepID=UPI001ED88F8C|nr:uncharacterized protein LOC124155951 [Ischnura elegans]